jgi:hypothetical protein
MITRIPVLLATLALCLFPAASFAATDSGRQLYQTECGACHVAYPAAFLATDSWDALLNKLDDHFGDNAELAAGDLASIKAYLDSNNYDQSSIKRR